MEPGLKTHVSDGTATVTISNTGKRNAMTAADVAGSCRRCWSGWRPTGRPGAGADRRGRDLLRGRRHLDRCGSRRRGVAGPGGGGPRRRWRRSPKPTLAAIRGYCVGGGAQLAAACDLRFAEEGALFGVTPAKLAIVYPASSTRRLVSLVGPATAKYLLFSGELIDCARALRTGLVDEVLPEGELGKRVDGVHPGTGAPVAADAGRGEGVRERAVPTGTRTGPSRRARAATPRRVSPRSWSAGRRASPGHGLTAGPVRSPWAAADSSPSSTNRPRSRSNAVTSAGAFSGEPAS